MMKIIKFSLFVMFCTIYKIGKSEIINKNIKDFCFLNNTIFSYLETFDISKNISLSLYTHKEYKWELYMYLYTKTEISDLNAIKKKIVNTGKPINGFEGILYQVNTFMHKRFFDEDLFMKLSTLSNDS